MRSIIHIDEQARTPKYKQIAHSIIEGVASGALKTGDKLPSVNNLLIEFDLSRDTIVKAYDHLKEMGVVKSVPGKGYYIAHDGLERKARVFLLFNKLSTHKKIVYDAFIQELGEDSTVDFFIYRNNYRLFKELIFSHKDEPYTHFVIIAHFLEGGMFAEEVINQIPRHKLILMDKLVPGVTGEYSAVYQDFAKDIYHVLIKTKDLLRKYQKLKIIFPPYSYHAIEILDGFEEFCAEYAFPCEIVKDIKTVPIHPGEVFINLMEDDLVTLIKRIKALDLKVGQDVGIISYNETPLKEILLEGITVISTDFEELGRTAARMVLGKQQGHMANPFRLILRNSL